MEGNYLTEEELERLIAETEENWLLHAPKRLKQNVLAEINGELTAFEPEPEKVPMKQVQLLLYGLKVSLAAAAAIVVLFNMNFTQEERQPLDRQAILQENLQQQQQDQAEKYEQYMQKQEYWQKFNGWFESF